MKGLKQARKDRAFSQKDLAAIIEVTVQTISNWECGQRSPDTHYMKKLAKVLQFDYNKLMGVK